MLSCKSSGYTLFALVFLVAAPFVTARAQTVVEPSGGGVINLGGLPGATSSVAKGGDNAALVQVAGYNVAGDAAHAAGWSGGRIIDVGGLPGAADRAAAGMDNAGQEVGYDLAGAAAETATEWTGGSVVTWWDRHFPPLPNPPSRR